MSRNSSENRDKHKKRLTQVKRKKQAAEDTRKARIRELLQQVKKE